MLQPLIAQAAETKERTGQFWGFLVTDFGAGATLAFDFGGGFGNAIALDGFLSLPIIGEPAVAVKLTGSARILLATHPKEAPPPAFNTLPGAAAHPDVVVGPDAAGAPPTKSPILAAGSDGANVRILLTDAAGREIAIGAAAEGVALVGSPIPAAQKDAGGLIRVVEAFQPLPGIDPTLWAIRASKKKREFYTVAPAVNTASDSGILDITGIEGFTVYATGVGAGAINCNISAVNDAGVSRSIGNLNPNAATLSASFGPGRTNMLDARRLRITTNAVAAVSIVVEVVGG